MPTRPLLTKSRFLAGRQCSKRLWRQVRAPLEDRSGSSRVAHNGTEIGSLAHRLFSLNAVLLSWQSWNGGSS